MLFATVVLKFLETARIFSARQSELWPYLPPVEQRPERNHPIFSIGNTDNAHTRLSSKEPAGLA